MGGRGHGESGCGGASASSAGAPCASGAGPGDGNAMDLNDNDNENNNDYEDNALDDNADGDDEEPEEANAPLVDINLRRACLLCGVIRTNENYGLGPMTRLLDASANALAVFEAAELQAPTFFASG